MAARFHPTGCVPVNSLITQIKAVFNLGLMRPARQITIRKVEEEVPVFEQSDD